MKDQLNDNDLQHLAAIVRDSEDAIIGKTLDGIITSWNGGAQQIYGYTAHEAIGRPIAMLIPPDHDDELPTILRRLAEGAGIQHYDTLRVTKDGRFVDISLTVSPIRDAAGAIVGASSIGRDVTEQKAAAAAVRASARAYQLLMEQASDAILVSYPNQRLLEVNQRACAMLGYSREELLQLTENDIILPESVRALSLQLDAILSGKIVSMDRALRRKDGAVLIAELSIRRLDDGRIVTIARDITERKRAEHLLQASEARYRGIVEDQIEPVVRFLRDGTLTFVNAAACRAWGVPHDALLGSAVFRFLPGSGGQPLAQYLATFDHDHTVATTEQRTVATDGTERWVQWTLRALFDDQGACVEYQAVGVDLTAHKVAQATLQTRELQLAEAQAIAHVGSWELDLATRVVVWSDELYRIFGLEPRSEPASVEAYQRFVHPEDRALVSAEVARAISERGTFDFEHRVLRPDGSVGVICSRARVIVDQEGRPVTLRGASIDITERKAFEAQLQRQAFHDPLTGLANRALFNDRVEHALARTNRSALSLAVMYLDIDRFKVVNDSLTHAAGDQLLVEFGRRVQGGLRPEDTVARLGGDEFAVLLVNVATTADAQRAAERILDVLRAPFALGEHAIVVTTSIGIAVSAVGQRDAGELLRAADLAMYRAKQTGKAHYELFDSTMLDDAVTRLQLETELRGAIDRDELVLHYQPIISVATGTIQGVEALVRWQHPIRGLIPPGVFIPIAEETGLIVRLGEWVLHRACTQAAAWRAAGLPSWYVAVNVAALQLRQVDLVGTLHRILREHGLPPAALDLELTESNAMADPQLTARVLTEAQALGVHGVSIDDFGTGYSSLRYLQQFPVTRVKIDRSFVRDVQANRNNAALARAIIAMAHSMQLTVVGEGVETAAQLAFLRSHKCDAVQGYLFSPPVPAAALEQLLHGDRLRLPDLTPGVEDAGDGLAEAMLAALLPAYVAALRNADSRAADEVIRSSLEQGLSPGGVARHLMQPAAYRIGELWQRNEMSVAQEHLATAIMERQLGALHAQAAPRPALNRTIVIGAVAGELHRMGSRMVADAFEEEGWRVLYLGADVSIEAFVGTVREAQPDVIGLSAQQVMRLPQVTATITALNRSSLGAIPVLVGGLLFREHPELAKDVGASGTGQDAAGAVQVASRLLQERQAQTRAAMTDLPR